jgi:Transposase and inactivated derivatives
VLPGVKEAKGDEKKKSYGYQERDEGKRQRYLKKLKGYDHEKLYYLDESGIDRGEGYAYGWCAKGKRLYAEKSGIRQGRVNLIGALNRKGIKAPFVFEGNCDARVFETYIERCLLPVLSSGDVVIMDNARYHHTKKVKALLKSKDCKLIYLPPYSPDLNPIEHFWFPLKNAIRKLLDKGMDLMKAAYNILNKMSSALC